MIKRKRGETPSMGVSVASFHPVFTFGGYRVRNRSEVPFLAKPQWRDPEVGSIFGTPGYTLVSDEPFLYLQVFSESYRVSSPPFPFLPLLRHFLRRSL